jgi:hypothetical protein
LKTKIAKSLRNGKEAKEMQLILPATASTGSAGAKDTLSEARVLDDEAQLHQLGIVNDQILHLVFWVAGDSTVSTIERYRYL